MTEDQLEEQSEVLAKLGTSAEGTHLRARMQSACLLSDMESFKVRHDYFLLGSGLWLARHCSFWSEPSWWRRQLQVLRWNPSGSSSQERTHFQQCSFTGYVHLPSTGKMMWNHPFMEGSRGAGPSHSGPGAHAWIKEPCIYL